MHDPDKTKWPAYTDVSRYQLNQLWMVFLSKINVEMSVLWRSLCVYYYTKTIIIIILSLVNTLPLFSSISRNNITL